MRRLRHALLRTLSLLLVALALAGCNADPLGPALGEAELRILFVGNSLTSSNDLPGLVRTIAAHQGLSVAAASVAGPDFALEDHWHQGIGEVFREETPDLVVMQQGPSSLPGNQEHLREWAGILGEAARESGAHPALMMVWPDRTRVHAFDAVRDAYRNAALAIEGDFIPVGEVIRALLANPGVRPLSSDGFHPSHLGSVAAALTVLRRYHPDVLDGLPAEIAPANPRDPPVRLTASQLAVIVAVIERIASEHGF